MNASLSLVSVLFLIGMTQGLFLASVLFSLRYGNRKANRYLGGLTLAFVLVLSDYFLEYIALPIDLIWLRTLIWPKEFLLGAFMYLYVRQLTRPDVHWSRRRTIIHFIPAALHILVTWPLLLLEHESQFSILFADADVLTFNLLELLYGDVEALLTFVQISVYLVLSLKLLREHRIRITHQFSNLEKINLNWLNRLLFGLVAIYIFWLCELFFIDVLFTEALVSVLVGSSIVMLIFLMGFLGLQQPLIFSDDSRFSRSEKVEIVTEHSTTSSTENSPKKEKYQNSALSAAQCESLFIELQQYMNHEKLYLNNELSLTMLADQMSVSTNYLSQIINQQAEKSFFDYINEFRVLEAKSKLTNESGTKRTILELAMSVGFNSKSAFYNAFKKHTSMTPSEYRKSLNPTK
jgi:AraC-like DNA-binding protein